jgi:hypothetical protein
MRAISDASAYQLIDSVALLVDDSQKFFPLFKVSF